MKALRKAIRRMAKRMADYRHYRQRGHSIRQSWLLVDRTL